MENPYLNGLGSPVDLNENPAIPMTETVVPPGGNSSRSLISIGQFTVNTYNKPTSEISLTEMLLNAKKDSSNE